MRCGRQRNQSRAGRGHFRASPQAPTRHCSRIRRGPFPPSHRHLHRRLPLPPRFQGDRGDRKLASHRPRSPSGSAATPNHGHSVWRTHTCSCEHGATPPPAPELRHPLPGHAARLTTGPGGLTPDRAGFAPAGRRSGFPELNRIVHSSLASRAWSQLEFPSSYANGPGPGVPTQLQEQHCSSPQST
jgi:hypothetical protein